MWSTSYFKFPHFIQIAPSRYSAQYIMVISWSVCQKCETSVGYGFHSWWLCVCRMQAIIAKSLRYLPVDGIPCSTEALSEFGRFCKKIDSLHAGLPHSQRANARRRNIKSWWKAYGDTHLSVKITLALHNENKKGQKGDQQAGPKYVDLTMSSGPKNHERQ